MRRHGFRATTTAAVACLAVLAGGCGQAAPPPRAEVHATYDEELHARLPDDVRAAGVLRIATDASYPPMSSFAEDGRSIVGFEPDLAAAIGRVLGLRVELVETGFTDVLPAVRRGGVDLALTAMTDTAQRARLVDFVDYFSAGTAVVVRRGNPSGVADLKDLCGKVVAVERGTTQVDLLERAQVNCDVERIDVRVFATNSDALLQLRTGRATAVLNDLPPAALVTTDPRTSHQYQLASTTQYEPGLYGIGVAKTRPGLRDAVRDACERLLRTGVYQRLLDRWGIRSGAVRSIAVNSGR